jgi:hypothetical protein
MADSDKLYKPLADKDLIRSAPDWWRDNGYDPQDDDDPPFDPEMDDFIRGGK